MASASTKTNVKKPEGGRTSTEKVLILMGTHNGEPYLDEQLQSIESQTVNMVDIVVSDDNSSDHTREILSRFAKAWSKGAFSIVDGPAKGFAENFRSLLTKHVQNHDFVAFSDQDDIWDKDKLAVALNWLRQHNDKPALYCSRTRYVDEQGNYLRLSPLFSKPPALHNALVQSLAGGNTMVMNRKAARLVADASREKPFVSHDWWAYIVVSACGGEIYYDPTPHISYRQHGGNLLGANDTMAARMRRIVAMTRGQYARWNDINLAALEHGKPHWTPAAVKTIKMMQEIRTKSLFSRLYLLARSGFYRQTLFGRLGLIASVILRRF